MEVVFDRAGADEQLSGDLSVRVSLRDKAGDLRLLRRQLTKGIDGPDANMLAGRFQFDARALGKGLRPEVGEEVMRCTQLRSCVDSPTLTSQPLTVEQVSASEIDGHPSPTESFDRLDIAFLGSLIFYE